KYDEATGALTAAPVADVPPKASFREVLQEILTRTRADLATAEEKMKNEVTLPEQGSTLPKTGFGRVILPDIASKLNAALGKPWFEMDEALTALPDRVPSTISAYITAWQTEKWNQILTKDGISYSFTPTVQDPRNIDMTQKAAGERWTKLTSEN